MSFNPANLISTKKRAAPLLALELLAEFSGEFTRDDGSSHLFIHGKPPTVHGEWDIAVQLAELIHNVGSLSTPVELVTAFAETSAGHTILSICLVANVDESIDSDLVKSVACDFFRRLTNQVDLTDAHASSLPEKFQIESAQLATKLLDVHGGKPLRRQIVVSAGGTSVLTVTGKLAKPSQHIRPSEFVTWKARFDGRRLSVRLAYFLVDAKMTLEVFYDEQKHDSAFRALKEDGRKLLLITVKQIWQGKKRFLELVSIQEADENEFMQVDPQSDSRAPSNVQSQTVMSS